MLRSLVIGQLGRYGDPDMISESKRRFSDHVSEKDAIPADIKSAVFSAALSGGDESIFDHLVAVSCSINGKLLVSNISWYMMYFGGFVIQVSTQIVRTRLAYNYKGVEI